MKGKILFVILAVATITVFKTAAQGTLYISNLGEPTSELSANISRDTWNAVQFVTGTNSGGYLLGSIQVLLSGTGGSGIPNGFSLLFYADNGGQPGNSLGTLSGSSNPSTAGTYTYMASCTILSSLTPYWVVMTSATSISAGDTYGWQVSSSSDYIPQWRLECRTNWLLSQWHKLEHFLFFHAAIWGKCYSCARTSDHRACWAWLFGSFLTTQKIMRVVPNIELFFRASAFTQN